MGFFSSIGSAISSAVSGAASIVSSAMGSLGSAISSVGGFASNLLKVASPYIGAVMQVVQVISTVMGLLKPDEDPEQLGDRALRAEKTPEDFDTTKEYMEYLRNGVEFDQEAFDKLTPEEKLARSAVGTGILMKAINEEKGFEVDMDTWVSLGKLQDKGLLANDTISTFLEDFKDEQSKLNSYVKGDLKGQDNLSAANKMAEAYKKIEPNLSQDEIEEKVMNSRVGE